MLNISLQPSGGTLPSSFFPPNLRLAGYTTAMHNQGQNLPTSMLIAVGTVVLTLLITAPCACALAQLRFRWISGARLAILVSQMIPGVVIANALHLVREYRPAQLHPRAGHRRTIVPVTLGIST